MSALSLRLPDSVHRHINGRTYISNGVRLCRVVELTLCPFWLIFLTFLYLHCKFSTDIE